MTETGSVRLANWRWTSVGDLGDVSGGVTKNSSKANLPITLPYLRVANVYANELRLDDIAEIGVTQAESVRALLAKGDLLIVEGNGSIDQIGRVAIWSGKISPCLHQNHLIKVRFTISGLEPFVLYWLLSPDGRQHVIRAASSTSGLHTLSLSKVASLPAPLAPIPEQRRIVEAIESYFTRLDDAVATLERVQRNLKRYRASVLKAAVEGRLVPTEAELARAEGRDYEPASVLLERILAERRRRWQEAGGRGKYDEPVGPNTIELAELPEGWCWANLALMKEFSLYGPRFSSDDYAGDGRLVLRTSDISESGKVNLATAPRLPLHDGEFTKYRIKKGDLLVTRTGSLGTLAVFNDSVDAIPGAYLIQFRLASPLETSWYCFYFLKSPTGQSRLKVGGAGVGRPNLNAPTIESIGFGVPPLAEQARILVEVERLLWVVEALRHEVNRNLARCSRLRQSILKWAFEGKLADQDPSDEPASALLERIRSQTSASRQRASDADDRRRRRSGRRSPARAKTKP